MSRKKNLRRVSVLITPQTLFNLTRLADMAGYREIGRVIDKLTRDHMMALGGKREKTPLREYKTEELMGELWERAE